MAISEHEARGWSWSTNGLSLVPRPSGNEADNGHCCILRLIQLKSQVSITFQFLVLEVTVHELSYHLPFRFCPGAHGDPTSLAVLGKWRQASKRFDVSELFIVPDLTNPSTDHFQYYVWGRRL